MLLKVLELKYNHFVPSKCSVLYLTLYAMCVDRMDGAACINVQRNETVSSVVYVCSVCMCVYRGYSRGSHQIQIRKHLAQFSAFSRAYKQYARGEKINLLVRF